jgi:uncharacterized membrane protein
MTANHALTIIAALGCGVVGGAFFAFSGFVMRALARLSPPQGIAAMQSINIVAVTPPLMVALFGTALVCVALIIVALLDRQAAGTGYRLAGCLLYLVGTVGVTMVFNVPLNNALAAADPESATGAAQWAQYVSSWTAWNTLRTVASIAAALAFTLALVAER